MSIAQAEDLKRDLTDKFVVVEDGVPELRRFTGLTGQVKTVNMNARALVQFDNPVDISWYDIDPRFLKVVDAPLPKSRSHAPTAAEAAPPAAAAPVKKPAATAGMSPLDALRAAKPGAAAVAPASGEKKLSPLELLRQQAAAKKGAVDETPAPPAAASVVADPPPPAPPAAVAEPAPAAPPTSAPLPQLGSTAEIIAFLRQQGAAKR